MAETNRRGDCETRPSQQAHEFEHHPKIRPDHRRRDCRSVHRLRALPRGHRCCRHRSGRPIGEGDERDGGHHRRLKRHSLGQRGALASPACAFVGEGWPAAHENAAAARSCRILQAKRSGRASRCAKGKLRRAGGPRVAGMGRLAGPSRRSARCARLLCPERLPFLLYG